MTDAADIEDALVTNAEGPKSVSIGNQSVDQHPLKDQIAAAQYAAGAAAVTADRPGLGLRFQTITPYYR